MDRMAKSQAARFFHSLYRTRSSGDVDRESFGPSRRAGPKCHDIGVWDPLHVWQEWGPWKRFRVLLVYGLEERKPLSLHDALVRQHPLQVRQGRLRVTVPPAPPRFPPAFNTAPVRRAPGRVVAAAAPLSRRAYLIAGRRRKGLPLEPGGPNRWLRLSSNIRP